jgi:hypothetical protein
MKMNSNVTTYQVSVTRTVKLTAFVEASNRAAATAAVEDVIDSMEKCSHDCDWHDRDFEVDAVNWGKTRSPCPNCPKVKNSTPPPRRDFAFQAASFSTLARPSSRAERRLSSVRNNVVWRVLRRATVRQTSLSSC